MKCNSINNPLTILYPYIRGSMFGAVDKQFIIVYVAKNALRM